MDWMLLIRHPYFHYSTPEKRLADSVILLLGGGFQVTEERHELSKGGRHMYDDQPV